MARSKRPNAYIPSRGRFAGRQFASKHQYRDTLPRSRGYRDSNAQRRAYRVLGSRTALDKLSWPAIRKRNHAFEVLREMRQGSLSLSGAVRRFNEIHPDSRISARTVHKYVGPALRKGAAGWRAKSYDRLLRVIRFPTTGGMADVEIRDSRTASKLGGYMNGVRVYLETGDDSMLRKYRHQSITSGKKKIRFLTDLDAIRTLGDAGELQFDTIYQELGKA